MTQPPDTPDTDGLGSGFPDPSRTDERLARIRDRIIDLDRSLITLVAERRDLVLRAGEIKAELGLPVLDPAREAKVVRRAAQLARDEGVDEELVRDVIWRIIASARDAQEGRTRWGPPRPLDPDTV